MTQAWIPFPPAVRRELERRFSGGLLAVALAEIGDGSGLEGLLAFAPDGTDVGLRSSAGGRLS
jgi:hypothetical protein